MLAVRREDSENTGQVDAWLQHQYRQAGNEIQRLKDHQRGTVSLRHLELATEVAVRRE